MEAKNEREYSATCMACGWGEGGGKERGKCGARAQSNGEGRGGEKGADAERGPKEGADAARASKREHWGAVTSMEWCGVKGPTEGRDGEIARRRKRAEGQC